jgi:hypothetical protein
MSKKHPTCEAETRWRRNYRYRRQLASWREEEAIGDPLGFAAELRSSGTMAKLAEAVLSTGPERRVGLSSPQSQAD